MPNLTLTKQVNWYRWWLRNFPLADVDIIEYIDGSAFLTIRNAQGHVLHQPFGSFRLCEGYFLKQWATKNFALTIFYEDGRMNAHPKMEEHNE